MCIVHLDEAGQVVHVTLALVHVEKLVHGIAKSSVKTFYHDCWAVCLGHDLAHGDLGRVQVLSENFVIELLSVVVEYCVWVLASELLVLPGDALERGSGALCGFVLSRNDPRVRGKSVDTCKNIIPVVVQASTFVVPERVVTLKEARLRRQYVRPVPRANSGRVPQLPTLVRM